MMVDHVLQPTLASKAVFAGKRILPTQLSPGRQVSLRPWLGSQLEGRSMHVGGGKHVSYPSTTSRWPSTGSQSRGFNGCVTHLSLSPSELGNTSAQYKVLSGFSGLVRYCKLAQGHWLNHRQDRRASIIIIPIG